MEASNCAHIFLRTHARSLLSCCGHPRWVAREHAELERILRHFGDQIRRRTGKSRGVEVSHLRRSLALGCSRACRARGPPRPLGRPDSTKRRGRAGVAYLWLVVGRGSWRPRKNGERRGEMSGAVGFFLFFYVKRWEGR